MKNCSSSLSSWRRAVLPASLILNLFLIALIGGHVLRHSRQGVFASGGPLTAALVSAEASLPSQDAAAFHGVIQNEAPRYTVAAERLAQARVIVAQDVTAENFDPAAVRMALQNWRSAWNGFFDVFNGTIVDALSVVSPEGRRKLIADRKEARRKSPIPSLAQ